MYPLTPPPMPPIKALRPMSSPRTAPRAAPRPAPTKAEEAVMPMEPVIPASAADPAIIGAANGMAMAVATDRMVLTPLLITLSLQRHPDVHTGFVEPKTVHVDLGKTFRCVRVEELHTVGF